MCQKNKKNLKVTMVNGCWNRAACGDLRNRVASGSLDFNIYSGIANKDSGPCRNLELSPLHKATCHKNISYIKWVTGKLCLLAKGSSKVFHHLLGTVDCHNNNTENWLHKRAPKSESFTMWVFNSQYLHVIETWGQIIITKISLKKANSVEISKRAKLMYRIGSLQPNDLGCLLKITPLKTGWHSKISRKKPMSENLDPQNNEEFRI